MHALINPIYRGAPTGLRAANGLGLRVPTRAAAADQGPANLNSTAVGSISKKHATDGVSNMSAQEQDQQLQKVQQQQQQHGPHSSTPFTDVGIEELRQQLDVFAAERHWQQFHTPRNLLMALVGEVGELSEIFQWRGEVPPGLPDFSAADRAHVGQELADVLLYLIRLADVAGVDLGQAVRDKLAANATKYPVEQCRGKADKYTAYAEAKPQHKQQQEGQQQQQQQPGQ